MTAAYRSGPDRLVDALLPDGRRIDITLRGGRIAAIDPHQSESPAPSENALDFGGALVLPAFVDGHCHLDKTFLGAPWQPHRVAGSLRERIANEKALRSRIGVPVTERATALANRMVSLGTGHVRSHVDIDLEAGLTGLHALLEVRAALRDRISIQLVAFPQSGVVTAPGWPSCSTPHWPRALR